MATYLKRTSKLFDISLTRDTTELNLRDLICPICRGILIEPVTLPCTHNLCLGCLKGTFEHNSLSCPLCRVRVGSWLRTATKSETLVNTALWELIRTRFSKEVEGKHNGDEGDIELDSGFTSKKVILSAAGEIRREYEVQLQMAEEEMRRQRESERLANEALIRKIRAEDEQQLAQLAQDQLMAKNLAKKQLLNKEKSAMKYYSECKISNSGVSEKSIIDQRLVTDVTKISTSFEKTNLQIIQQDITKSNVSIVSKIRGDKQIIGKPGFSNINSVNDKVCSQKSLPVHNAVTRTLKHQTIGKFSNSGNSNYVVEPSCSNTQIYGSRSKEELHVPKDVLNNKKKCLGVEVCMTTGDNNERIGSAESAGSHDSINQEIHHFKPIKPIARTALKMSYDGRPIDPKLVRVIPIVKRISNAMPKPPSPTHVKRIIGCSWSAFRGKARQNLELRQSTGIANIESDSKYASTSSLHSHQISGKIIKSQVSETVRRLDLAPDLSFDSNKNYAKSINRILNGTKVSKRLIMDETVEILKPSKLTKLPSSKNGMKNKRQRSLWNEKKVSVSEERDSSCSPIDLPSKITPDNNDNSCTIENIAERIKRRKINRENLTIIEAEVELPQRNTRRQRLHATKPEVEDIETIDDNLGTSSKRKRNVVKSAASIESNNDSGERRTGNKRNARKQSKTVKVKRAKTSTQNDSDDESLIDDLPRDDRNISKENSFNDIRDDLDKQIVQEQQRMERLIIQEKEDFEIALRLQAQFNDMERIAGRTRGSRRAMENNNEDLQKLTKKTRIKTNSHTASQGITSDNSNSNKQRRRPQKQAA